MNVSAKLRHVRVSARKLRLIANLIRGKRLEDALNAVVFSEKKTAKPMESVLKSAAANAGNVEGMDTMNLFVSEVRVDEGPTWKRFMPRAMGRASAILKRTSHISLTLAEHQKKVIAPEVVTPEVKKESKPKKAVKSKKATSEEPKAKKVAKSKKTTDEESKPKKAVKSKKVASKSTAKKIKEAKPSKTDEE